MSFHYKNILWFCNQKFYILNIVGIYQVSRWNSFNGDLIVYDLFISVSFFCLDQMFIIFVNVLFPLKIFHSLIQIFYIQIEYLLLIDKNSLAPLQHVNFGNLHRNSLVNLQQTQNFIRLLIAPTYKTVDCAADLPQLTPLFLQVYRFDVGYVKGDIVCLHEYFLLRLLPDILFRVQIVQPVIELFFLYSRYQTLVQQLIIAEINEAHFCLDITSVRKQNLICGQHILVVEQTLSFQMIWSLTLFD